MSYLYLALSILFNVVSYFVYRGIAGKENNTLWHALFAIGLILGAINAYFFTKSLKSLSLSIAYPIFSGACITLMVLMSYFIFREKLNIYNLFGAIVVIFGIVLLTR